MRSYFTLLLLAVSLQAYAQPAFPAYDAVDINNINARVMVHGDMFWEAGTSQARCEFPRGSGKHINFASALWMSGYDAASNLHIAAQTYRQEGNDYWPGPLEGTHDTLTYAASSDWAKIWKVNRSDINAFRAMSIHDSASTLPDILTWPGAGNRYARGVRPLALTAGKSYAPFADLNSNGIYEPLLGEYPDVKGDQALWWMFSDNGPAHTQSNGVPIKVEVQAMAYAYSRGTIADNIIYFDYIITNRSSNNYHDFRVGLWDDVALGYRLDDFIAFDSAHRMGITYGATRDDGLAEGHPANSYGTNMPMVGITMITLPGDAAATYVPAGSFTTFRNDLSIVGNPTNETEYNYYLRSRYRSGAHFANTFTGPGSSCDLTGTGPDVNYLYSGDPAIASAWSECACNNNPGERNFVLTSNDFTLNAGTSRHILMAMVATTPDTLAGCPMVGLDAIKEVADTAWYIYHNPPEPSAIATVKTQQVNVFPNPAGDKLTVEGIEIGADNLLLTVFNTLGQAFQVPFTHTGTTLQANISILPCGMYQLNYSGHWARFQKL